MVATAAHYAPMTTIKLSGSLAQKFGCIHRRHLDSGESWEVFKALRATVVGFEEEIRCLDSLGMRFAIFRNGKNVGEKDLGRRGTSEIRIVPVLAGSKRGGILKTIIGAVLIVASFYSAPRSRWALR